ncbi:hypothetical protein CLOBOL_05169 [Enterocloster bolteae ATCC BAA-613]|uniref:Uncharacterized protein n=1 Tax=Enterocloster bolteae (strain ATCC BAA-613 / DSM 15670 / CCUG 46953 / JCM 12243 / WAL 16351) TaxID=411902 RepID=A8RYM4_ENTBW|nr:hypothetical protein CLOBOL_05169 [Enterocloster bolteae ATCC BAA-613]
MGFRGRFLYARKKGSCTCHCISPFVVREICKGGNES